MSPEQLAAKKAELTPEEQARRARFHEALGNLRKENKDLAEMQRQDRLAKCRKDEDRALRITVILNLMLLMRGKSLDYVSPDLKCRRCGHVIRKGGLRRIHNIPRHEWGEAKARKLENLIRETQGLDEFIG